MTIKMTREDFLGLGWELTDKSICNSEIDFDVREADLGDGEKAIVENFSQSWVNGSAELTANFQGHEITLSFAWGANGSITGSYNDLFDFDVELGFDPYFEWSPEIESADEDDDDINDWCRVLLEEIFSWESDIQEILPQPEPETIEENAGEIMETFTVQRDNGPDIRFTGELITSASSSDNTAFSDYSGSTGRWAELALYRTAGGKFIAVQIGRTRWQGEHDRHSAVVCETEAQVIEFFGFGWLAKELYGYAGIDAAEEIE